MSAFCERIKPDPAEPDKALSTCDMITALASCPSFALIGEQCNAATIDAIEAALLENAQATLPPRSCHAPHYYYYYHLPCLQAGHPLTLTLTPPPSRRRTRRGCVTTRRVRRCGGTCSSSSGHSTASSAATPSRSATRHAPHQHPDQPPSPTQCATAAQPSPAQSLNPSPEPRAPSPSPALTGRSTPVLEASHRQPSHPYQVDAMSEQQLQRAKQLATKVLIQPSP